MSLQMNVKLEAQTLSEAVALDLRDAGSCGINLEVVIDYIDRCFAEDNTDQAVEYAKNTLYSQTFIVRDPRTKRLMVVHEECATDDQVINREMRHTSDAQVRHCKELKRKSDSTRSRR